MSKDTIFKDGKEFKEPLREPLRLFDRKNDIGVPKSPSSYYLSHPIPYIDFKTHIRLLPDDLVKEGDEFHYENEWRAAHPSRCNSFVGRVFLYRRARSLSYVEG